MPATAPHEAPAVERASLGYGSVVLGSTLAVVAALFAMFAMFALLVVIVAP